jgi:Na+-driven multidrug efflux pump
MRIILFALLPSWGLGNAAATMVGQSLGAGKPDRAERAVWRAGFYNMCFLGTVGLIFVLLAGPIIGLFTHDPAVIPYGVACLRTVACGFLFYAYGMVMTQSFNGAGDTRTPTIINLFVFWLWEIPLAYMLAIVFAGPIVGIFTQAAAGPEVYAYGKDCLRIVACGFLFYAYGMVLTQSFNGAGDTRTPTIINVVVFWLWEIPLAYTLAFVFEMGPHGIFLSAALAFSTLAVVSALVFRRGRWKTKRV